MAKKEKRFEVVFKEGSSLIDSGFHQIIVDKETGVNYLVFSAGYGLSVTPLYNSNGNIITTSVKD